MKFNRLNFGTGGIPICAKGTSIENGIQTLKKLNLDSMELEFVHSVNVSKEKAPEVKKTAEKNNIILSCHGQYYINLNALEIPKLKASQYRIVNAATRAFECGAFSMTFHPAFYLNMDKPQVYNNVKRALEEVIQTLKDKNIEIWVRPETTGKIAQFGNLDELIKLSSELEMVLPCIDFSHLHARSNGKFNSYEETVEVLERVEDNLGKHALENMHIHISGIEYSEKGERNHVNLLESDLKFREILRAWKEFNIKGSVICESPNLEEDATLLKKIYEEI